MLTIARIPEQEHELGESIQDLKLGFRNVLNSNISSAFLGKLHYACLPVAYELMEKQMTFDNLSISHQCYKLVCLFIKEHVLRSKRQSRF